MTLKIKPNDLRVLKTAVAPFDTAKRRARYLNGQFPLAQNCKDLDTRYRWDLLHTSGLKFGDGVGIKGALDLYAYLNDDHIDSALKSFIEPLANGKPQSSQALWSAEDPGTIALAMDAALSSGSKLELRALTSDLTVELNAAYGNLPDATRQALMADDSSSLSTTFKLGQLAFAQMLSAEALSRRPDEDLDLLAHKEMDGLITKELLEYTLTSQGLADRLGLDHSVIVERLQVLIDKGVVEPSGNLYYLSL